MNHELLDRELDEKYRTYCEVMRCPKCGGPIVNTAHGPYCPKETCKWGWETEMDGSPLRPVVSKRLTNFLSGALLLAGCFVVGLMYWSEYLK